MRRHMEERLLEWQRQEQRRPLLLHGARATGKTHLVRRFARQHYDHLLYVDFENMRRIAHHFAGDLAPDRLIRLLELETGVPVLPGKTLVFLDEIQFCARALASLASFCRERPDIHVLAAASLPLPGEAACPAGTVEAVRLCPLDFEEVLWARGQEDLAALIREHFAAKRPLPAPFHARALEAFGEYLVTGGMPRCVRQVVESSSLLASADRQQAILDTWGSDMVRCGTARGDLAIGKLRALFASLPAQLAGPRFRYNLAHKRGSSALLGPALEWLLAAGLVVRCPRVEQTTLPLAARQEDAFRLHLVDTGLLAQLAGIGLRERFWAQEWPFGPMLFQNYVAQQLTARGRPLFSWKSAAKAELAFLVQEQGALIGVEVQARPHWRSRSLAAFASRARPPFSYRFSPANFDFRDGVFNVPVYAAFCLAPE